MGLDPRLLRLLSPEILFPAASGLAGLAAGLTVAAVCRRRRLGAAPAEVDPDIVEEARDLKKTVYLLQNENRSLSNFLMTMPELARQLNDRVEPGRIPGLLTAFVEQLFEAEQILVFRSDAGGSLVLAGGKGIPETARDASVVPFGKGRLGWVAEHQRTMDESDFLNLPKIDQAAKVAFSADVHRTFRVEMCAPMVANGKTVGAISLGGLLRRPKNEKNMLKMVADFGSIALQNTLFRRHLEASANSDGLTGLANKRHFQQSLSEEVVRSEKEHQQLSLFIFDIDHFKHYNDTNGHLAGDEALRLTSRLIRESVRPDDLAARYGGEEFVVLLPGTGKDEALALAERIRARIEAAEYPNEAAQPMGRLTISGGVASCPFDARTANDLIRRADEALYAGKNAGRNRVVACEARYLSDESPVAGDAPAAGRQSM